MPYSNFDDTRSLFSSFYESQREDADMNISEFLFNKLLTFGELFDQGDDDEEQSVPKDHQFRTGQKTGSGKTLLFFCGR
ncbi:MAG: hypothetical protein JJE22_14645 [Bacteroidia bacterium]|nr:hypothetical protein [Bacteroidia bacterium]